MTNATLVADQAQKWVLAGTRVTWTNHQPASSLVQWSRARGLQATPPAMSAGLKMVCYELPIWAAYYAGVLNVESLYDLVREFDYTGRGSANAIMGAITSRFSPRRTLRNPAIAKFSRGDIVFFNNVGHVALASGRNAEPNEVYSVWGLDPSGTQPNTAVEQTTVGTLLAQIAMGAPRIDQTVTYSSPRW